MNYIKEETLLTAYETAFRIEGWITNGKYLQYSNSFGEHVFEFQPLTYLDHQMLMEQVCNVVTSLQMRIDPYSRKEPKASVETRAGMLYANQLFAPKLNVDNPEDYIQQCCQATITGHMRDLPDGSVVLQVEYVDFDEYVEPEIAPASDDDIEW